MLAVRQMDAAASLDTACPCCDGAPFQSGAGWWRAVDGRFHAGGLPSRRFPVVVQRRHGRCCLMPLLIGPGAGRLQRLGDAVHVSVPTRRWQPRADIEPRLRPPPWPGIIGAAIGPAPCCAWMGVDAEWAGWAPVLRGLRRAGLLAMPFDSFGNWFEPLDGPPVGRLSRRPAGRPARDRPPPRCAGPNATRPWTIAIAGPNDTAAYLAEYEQVSRPKLEASGAVPGRSQRSVCGGGGSRRRFCASLSCAGVGYPLAAQYWMVEASRCDRAEISACRGRPGPFARYRADSLDDPSTDRGGGM